MNVPIVIIGGELHGTVVNQHEVHVVNERPRDA